jgi:3-isopropylmalate dehydrogenase
MREAGGVGGLRSHTIAVVPGDGIGPEVTGEAVRVLEAVARAEGFKLESTTFDLGAERYLRSGEVLPNGALDDLRVHAAILMGAVGDPRVPPGILEGGLLLRLRQELDLYVNLRPAKLFEGVPSALAAVCPDDLDIVIVRENTEGLYSRRGQVVRLGTPQEAATELSINTAPAVARLIRYAFDLASSRGRSLTLVHKTNVLERAGALYLRIFESTAADYPDVATAYQHIDAAGLLLVTNPRRFSVIVTDNMFGDILSDLAAGLVGGLGYLGSGNINPGRVSLFEPVHGSAPDIAGTGKANPVGAILSAAMMLRHVGEEAAANRVEQAVGQVAGKIAGGGFDTRGMGELVVEAVS